MGAPLPFDYVFATPEQVEQMAEMRRKFADLYEMLMTLPGGHHKTQALHRLEEAGMWANKSVTHFVKEYTK